MKKKFLLCALLTGAMAFAANPVLTVNGETVKRAVTSISFDGENVLVRFTDGEASYDMEEIEVVYQTTGINDLQVMTTAAVIGDKLTVTGAADGSLAEVFDLKGRRLASADVVSGACTLETGSLLPGVYMLRIDNKIVKFVKR